MRVRVLGTLAVLLTGLVLQPVVPAHADAREATGIFAEPALLQVLPSQAIYAYSLTARLYLASEPRGCCVTGYTLNMEDRAGNILCQASDALNRIPGSWISCEITDAQKLDVTLEGGFRAVFDGDATRAPSSAWAGLFDGSG